MLHPTLGTHHAVTNLETDMLEDTTMCSSSCAPVGSFDNGAYAHEMPTEFSYEKTCREDVE